MDDPLEMLYKNFNPMKPLTADNTRDKALYVDWQAELVGPHDAVKYRLARSIVRSANQASTHLFTGARGAGKTTELHRLKHLLDDGQLGNRFFVAMLMAEDSLNVADLQADYLSFQIIRLLVTSLQQAGYRTGADVRNLFRDLADKLHRIDLDMLDVDDDSIEFTFHDKSTTAQQRKFQELLQGEIRSVYDIINTQLIPDARRWLKAEKDYTDILVIVDEIDKVALGSNHEELFLGGAGYLRALDCPVLYTVPIELAHSSHQSALRFTFGTDIKTLPIMPVTGPAEGIEPGAARALSEIVSRRANAAGFEIDQLFENAEVLAEILRACGGHVRTLLVLIRSMLDRIDDLPITRNILNLSLRSTAADLAQSLTQEAWRNLEEVHRTKDKVRGENHDVWNRLLRDSYVFTYYTAERGYWYDMNPLLRYADSRRRREF